MITGLDHFVLVCPDIGSGVDAFGRLLGRPADWQDQSGDGQASAMFLFGNTAMELIAPAADGAMAVRLREILGQSGPGLASLVFSTDDIGLAHEVQSRRANEPGPVTRHHSPARGAAPDRAWARFRISDERTGGLRVFILQQEKGRPGSGPVPADSVHGLDHLVVLTPAAERALAFYGAGLGLRLALDRTFPDWGVRLIFFRVGGLTLEFARRLADSPAGAEEADRFGGLSWAVKDIDRARERVGDAGFDVSQVRMGRKAGTRVFTVRDPPMGVPTLFIAHDAALEDRK